MTIMHDEVVTALRSGTDGTAGLELVVFVWENHSAEPQDANEIRVEDFFQPFEELPATSGDDRLTGQHHFNVVVQRGSGDLEARKVASLLKGQFRPGYSIVNGPTIVTVESSEIQQGRAYDENRYAFPVVVTFRVDGQRQTGE